MRDMRIAGSLQGVQTEQSRIVIHHFPEDYIFEEPSAFTDPFRYTPHSAVKVAARLVCERIEADFEVADSFAEGKMLGVLVCKDQETGNLGYVAAFSGNVGGRSHIEGFVPPIFDLLAPDGYFKIRETEITQINHKIQELSTSDTFNSYSQALESSMVRRNTAIAEFRDNMAAAKAERSRLRAAGISQEEEQRLTRESQFEKAEFKRLKTALQAEVDRAQADLDSILGEITALKKLRAEMSDKLQDWIFRQYIVHNALGESLSIADLFAAQGLTPPGGTGECAAPKLLEYAYGNGLQPLAMGEFWYGKASETAVRVHGHFYPSCTSKCGPLLGFMMGGLTCCQSLVIPKAYHLIYEDAEIIVVEKPSGMPSVPGLDGRVSLQELLERAHGQTIHAVHRLDMDTSGVIIYAKTAEAGVDLRKQFEEHTIKKTYSARLKPIAEGVPSETVLPPWPQGSRAISKRSGGPLQRTATTKEWEGAFPNTPPLLPATSVHFSSHISLPLAADYDERPRQKVDFKQGKLALTECEIVSENADGSIDVHFHPVTGRTHQLRVHSAHALGLCRPIIGDLLYGGHSITSADSYPHRLHLHALCITFRHPRTGEELTFTSDKLCY